MAKEFPREPDDDALQKLIGLGEFSARKSYYPELQETIRDLRQSESRLRSYVEAAPDGMFEFDAEGHFTMVNPAATAMSGYEADELLSMSFNDIVLPEDRDDADDFFHTLVAIRWSSGRLRFLTSNGATRHWDVDAVELAESRFLCFAKDVTAQVEMEDRLRQAEKMQAIGQLAGGIAHDFNNMLGGILGAVDLLENYLLDDPKGRRFHRMVVDSATRAADLTDKLLTFARKQPLAGNAVDLHRTLKDTIELLRRTIDRRIVVTLDQQAECSHIIGDASQLENVFLNLCINAAHVMPEGGAIAIRTRNQQLGDDACRNSLFDLEPGPHIEVHVDDTGCGIAPENLPRLFEPFFTTKRRGEGTGLGLAAAFGAVQQHGGAITVSSELGKGTSFRVLLPLTEAVDDTEPSAPTREVLGTGRILVVDDEEVNREIASEILEGLGYDVLVAYDGQHAVDIFQRQADEIDLVLLDMVMPRMNGRDCFFALREMRPDIRVVVSSGYTRNTELKEMQDSGLSGIIHKPFQGVELSHVVHDALVR